MVFSRRFFCQIAGLYHRHALVTPDYAPDLGGTSLLPLRRVENPAGIELCAAIGWVGTYLVHMTGPIALTAGIGPDKRRGPSDMSRNRHPWVRANGGFHARPYSMFEAGK